ncbi:MAG: dephospho-CoA kinase [Bacteroidetes bacterium]|nr:MAG: dephospho-CoA kinase [Bacteroidota bacterium]
MFATMVIGVTGGIGSGKTAVCKLLEQHGASVFYSDEEARQLMQSDARVREELETAFGPETWLEDDSLNRKFLASVIFSSKEQRLRMNTIVHPAVRKAFNSFRLNHERDGARLIVKEAALLFESGIQELDVIVVVDAPIDLRVQRVIDRDDVTEEQVHARIRGQMPATDMRKRADIIVDNSGSEDDLPAEVENLLAVLSAYRR